MWISPGKTEGTFLPGWSRATYNMLIGVFRPKLWRAQAFNHIFRKWPPSAILVIRYFNKIDRVLPLWVVNGLVKYAFDMCIGVTVTQGVLRRRSGSGRTENIIYRPICIISGYYYVKWVTWIDQRKIIEVLLLKVTSSKLYSKHLPYLA